MHDPMTVAFEIRRPWPQRSRSSDAKPGAPRWQARFQHWTWRHPLRGWRAFWTIAGRGYWWPSVLTVWHVEPRGHDSGEVCKHWRDGKVDNRWRWHVRHWHIQIPLRDKIHRFVFERCIECGTRFPWGYAPISHQWSDGPTRREWRIVKRAYHHPCSSLVMMRHAKASRDDLIVILADEVLTRAHFGVADLAARLGRAGESWTDAWRRRRLLLDVLGYLDVDGEIIRKVTPAPVEAP